MGSRGDEHGLTVLLDAGLVHHIVVHDDLTIYRYSILIRFEEVDEERDGSTHNQREDAR